jgi:hypothetical protein
VAADLICDLCEQESAAALYTNLANGDAMAIGAACMLTFALSVAAELAAGVPDDQREQYSEVMAKLAAALGRYVDSGVSLAEPPKRPRGRPRKAKTITDEDPQTGDLRTYDAQTGEPVAAAERAAGEPDPTLAGLSAGISAGASTSTSATPRNGAPTGQPKTESAAP